MMKRLENSSTWPISAPVNNAGGMLAACAVPPPGVTPGGVDGGSAGASATKESASLIGEHCAAVHYLSGGRVAVRFKPGTPLPAKRLVANLLRRRCVKKTDLQKVCEG